MKRNLEFIHDFLVKMDSRLDEMHDVQIKQQASLEDHIKRTELLEDQVGPLKAHMHRVEGAGVLLSILALIATIIAVVK